MPSMPFVNLLDFTSSLIHNKGAFGSVVKYAASYIMQYSIFFSLSSFLSFLPYVLCSPPLV